MCKTLIITLLLFALFTFSTSKKAVVLDVRTLELAAQKASKFQLEKLDPSRAVMINIQRSKKPITFTEL